MKRVWTLAAVCMVPLSVLFLSACSSVPASSTQSAAMEQQPAATPAEAKPLEEVTVGTLISVASIPLFIADERQLGAKHGIDFKLKTYQDPQQKNAGFAAGQFPVDSGNLIAGAQLVAQGIPVRFLYGLSDFSNRILVNKDFPGASLADLKGHKLGIPSKTGAQVPLYRQIAKEAGFDFLTDIEIVTAPPPAVPQLLADGKVDAVEVWEPATSLLLATGKYKVLFDPRQWYRQHYGDGFAFLVLIARNEFLQSNPTAARGLMATMAESVDWIRNNPEEAAHIFAKVAKIENEAQIKLLAEDIPGSLVSKWDANTFQVMQPFLDWAVAAQQLSAKPDPGLIQWEDLSSN